MLLTLPLKGKAAKNKIVFSEKQKQQSCLREAFLNENHVVSPSSSARQPKTENLLEDIFAVPPQNTTIKVKYCDIPFTDKCPCLSTFS